jgi:hypothetical protein
MRLALDLGLALDEAQVEADVVQGRTDVVQVEVDVMQGPATRRRVAVDVAQENDGTDETNEIGDETDETDEIGDETDETETDETDETDDFSSVQREPAAGNIAQRGAERLKNSRQLARSKENST